MSTVRKIAPKIAQEVRTGRAMAPMVGMEEFFENFMPRRWIENFFEPGGLRQPMWSEFGNPEAMGVDLIDRERELLVRAELPGIRREHVEVTIAGDYLQIEATRKFEEKQKGESFFRNELGFGKLARSIYLPCEVDHEKVKANLKDGILEITLPKVKAAKRHTIKIA